MAIRVDRFAKDGLARWVAVVALGAVVGCGGVVAGVGGTSDATVSDSPGAPALPDAMNEATPIRRHDAGNPPPDARADGKRDAGTDAGADAATDAGTDGASDAGEAGAARDTGGLSCALADAGLHETGACTPLLPSVPWPPVTPGADTSTLADLDGAEGKMLTRERASAALRDALLEQV